MRNTRLNKKALLFQAIIMLIILLVLIVVLLPVFRQFLGVGERAAVQAGCAGFLEASKGHGLHVTARKLVMTKDNLQVELPCATVDNEILTTGRAEKQQEKAVAVLKKAMKDCHGVYKPGGAAFDARKGNVCIVCSKQTIPRLDSVAGLDNELRNTSFAGRNPSSYRGVATVDPVGVVVVYAQDAARFMADFTLRNNVGVFLWDFRDLDALNCALLLGDPLIVKKTR